MASNVLDQLVNYTVRNHRFSRVMGKQRLAMMCKHSDIYATNLYLANISDFNELLFQA